MVRHATPDIPNRQETIGMPLPTSFHPAVRAWFERTFEAPTEAQARGWAEIAQGRDTLIAAATGSGKTLAAFLAGIDGLVQKAYGGGLQEGIEGRYVSPLKALSSDARRNLDIPLEGVRAAAEGRGLSAPAGHTARRT